MLYVGSISAQNVKIMLFKLICKTTPSQKNKYCLYHGQLLITKAISVTTAKHGGVYRLHLTQELLTSLFIIAIFNYTTAKYIIMSFCI